jgi:hypothetical protein
MRRCIDKSCILAAHDKSRYYHLDMPVATILDHPKKEWNTITAGNKKFARDLSVDWHKFPVEEYLFTHCTIVSSVNVEDNGYYIKPVCSELVNNNGNAWSDPVLLATFRSFVNAENYYEHVQVPALSKGKILDAVIRPVKFASATGQSTDVYYVDILVATHKKHNTLVSRIAGGELTTMSMGCIAHWVQCSRCGKEISDSMENCEHLDNELLQTFKDENGVERVVAELCGRCTRVNGKLAGDPKSVEFIEASWVEHPAFRGAVLNHYVSEITQKQASVLAMDNVLNCEDLFANLARLRVADVNGMLALRLAQEELKRLAEQVLVNRVVIWAKDNLVF